MPSIQFQCEKCDKCYKVIVFGEDTATPRCPKCKSTRAKPIAKAEPLFNGIANFSALAKDTD